MLPVEFNGAPRDFDEHYRHDGESSSTCPGMIEIDGRGELHTAAAGTVYYPAATAPLAAAARRRSGCCRQQNRPPNPTRRLRHRATATPAHRYTASPRHWVRAAPGTSRISGDETPG